MTSRLRRLVDDERGMSFVFVGVGFMAFLAATTLAIDVGLYMTARAQAQNSADAGAQAGAVALAFDSYTDRSTSGPAVQSALVAATANQVMGKAVTVTPADVTFVADPSGQQDRVRVNVYRTGNNAVKLMMGSLFHIPTANMSATATAEAAPANAMSCVKPFTIPDKWDERGNPPWDTNDTFDMYDKHGKLLPHPDVYVPADQAGYTGYDASRDRGTELVIRAGTGNNIMPTFFFSWKMLDAIGGDYYRDNIAGCSSNLVHWGDPMIQEPGDMTGPTDQGVDDLMAKDPNAYWDTANNRPHSSMNPSPRVFPIPLYDPAYYATGKANGRDASLRVANWIGFFLEGRSGNNVYGRITPITGVIDKNAGPAPANAFPKAIRIVQ